VNRALKRISLAVLVMFLLLLINANYLQAFEAPSLANGAENIRTISEQNQYQRGDIVTSDGMTVAKSVPLSGNTSAYKYQREYPGGAAFAPVTGFQGVNGDGGLEAAEDSLLSGSGSQLAFRNFVDMITNKPQKGATVELTVNSKAQQAAYAGLQSALQGTNRVGGVVALNPSTGAILAMASWPSYDPNELATLNGTTFNTRDSQLIHASPSPLINSATEATLPPGSTFKIVTSSAWFTQDSSRNPNSNVSSPTVLTLPQTSNQLHNDDDEACGNGSGTTTILYAFAQSCDTTFGNLGMDLGGSTLNSMAEKYGFNNSALNITGVSTATSQYVVPASLPLTAYSAIGQYSDTATPLQEAMLAATIADNGTLMKPYLVQQVTASDLSVVQTTHPSVMSNPVSPTVAGYVKQMMTAVVQQPEGTGFAFNQNVEGVEIAGKTGTAQNGPNASGLDDAVFTSFAPASNPKIAVGVMIEGGGYGASAAAPIAVNVIKAYLAAEGQG
jgi:peptidoglycan glycosyltransferase